MKHKKKKRDQNSILYYTFSTPNSTFNINFIIYLLKSDNLILDK